MVGRRMPPALVQIFPQLHAAGGGKDDLLCKQQVSEPWDPGAERGCPLETTSLRPKKSTHLSRAVQKPCQLPTVIPGGFSL